MQVTCRSRTFPTPVERPLCRVSSLQRPLWASTIREQRVGMAVTASSDVSRELGLAAVAYLSRYCRWSATRYRGTSREHTESDLRVFFNWCQNRQLAPRTAQRHDLELYLRWLQDVRRFKPPTVSRRLSVVAGFYRTCVIDGVLEHSSAEYVRRPNVPPESPMLGLFERPGCGAGLRSGLQSRAPRAQRPRG